MRLLRAGRAWQKLRKHKPPCFHLRMPWDFWLIFLVLGVLLPWRGYDRMRQLMALPEVTGRDRIKLYLDNSFSVAPDFRHWLARVCPRPHVARPGGLWRFPNYRARRVDHRRSPDRRRSLGQCPPDEPIQPSEFTASPRPWLSPVSAHTHRNYLVHAARPHRRYLRRVSLPRLCHGRVASRRPRHLARGHPLLCDVRHSPPVSGQRR